MKITIIKSSRQATVDGRQVKITPRDMNTLIVLAANRGKVMSRKRIITQAWPTDARVERVVDISIMAIRKIFGADTVQMKLREGYMLNPDVDIEVVDDIGLTLDGVTIDTSRMYISKDGKDMVSVLSSVKTDGKELLLLVDSGKYKAMDVKSFQQAFSPEPAQISY